METTPLAEIKVLDHGLVALMSIEGDDFTPAQAARTSYRSSVEDFTDEQNSNLVDYLIRHKHSTPLEFPGATFYLVMPIFVARQLVRSRTFSINEESLRYVEARDEIYVPSESECRTQSKTSKQGSSRETVTEPTVCKELILKAGEEAHKVYDLLLEQGLSKEIARTVLPVGQYTAWYWKANLRNIFHMLELRLDEHAQEQTRMYAQAMLDLIQPYYPTTIASWKNHVLNAVVFSRDECDILQELLLRNVGDEYQTSLAISRTSGWDHLRKTRRDEFIAKLRKIGVDI